MLAIFQNILSIKKVNTYKELQDKINEIRSRMEIVDNLFSNLSNADLIDACVYEKMALTSRYNYLLKQARELEQSIGGEKPA